LKTLSLVSLLSYVVCACYLFYPNPLILHTINAITNRYIHPAWHNKGKLYKDFTTLLFVKANLLQVPISAVLRVEVLRTSAELSQESFAPATLQPPLRSFPLRSSHLLNTHLLTLFQITTHSAKQFANNVLVGIEWLKS